MPHTQNLETSNEEDREKRGIIFFPKPYEKSMNEIEAIRGPIYSLGNSGTKQDLNN